MILAFYRLFTRVHCIGISKRCHNVTCFDNSICGTYGSGMDAGRGGVPRPAPPAKMIRSAGKWRGKKKVTFSNLSKRGK